jgi:hypothetical protein
MSNEIDIASLTTCEVAPEGYYVRLNFEDALGIPATLRLTSACVHQLTMTLPHALQGATGAAPRQIAEGGFPLGDWRLEAAAGSKDFVLTMITPDGFEVAFSLGASAIARMVSAFEKHRSMQGPTGLAS